VDGKKEKKKFARQKFFPLFFILTKSPNRRKKWQKSLIHPPTGTQEHWRIMVSACLILEKNDGFPNF